MSQPMILGTRGSDLALAQAHMVQSALQSKEIDCRIEVIRTIGDKRPDLKLSEFSQGDNPVVDKGIFTRELEEALLDGRIDFAVHSLKDVPTELAPDFEIVSTLPRAPIEDILLTKTPELVGDLALLSGKTVATSSVRRARQLKWLCPEVTVVDIRGNVPTRIRKLLENGEWDGILLARAGLERLGIFEPGKDSFLFEGAEVSAWELPQKVFLPAAGQGAVAMECLKSNERARKALERINHSSTFMRIQVERAFLHRLQAGCQTPVGVRTWYEEDGDVLGMRVRVFDEDDPDAEPAEAIVKGAPGDPDWISKKLMEKIGHA